MSLQYRLNPVDIQQKNGHLVTNHLYQTLLINEGFDVRPPGVAFKLTVPTNSGVDFFY